jgi:four helix bundle protein
MNSEEMKLRLKKFSIRIIKMTEAMRKDDAKSVLSKQIIRSVTSSAANYRAACRAKSTPDFINKLKIVEEETDETMFWLEVIDECEYFKKGKLNELIKENEELLKIVVASLKTSKNNSNKLSK